MNRVFKLKRDIVKHHHPALVFKVPAHQAAITSVDLRPLMPQVYDQGELGSCTANAIGAAYEFAQIKEDEAHPFVPSRLFIYVCERMEEGTVDEDSGAQIATGVECVSSIGVIPESEWPYDISKFAVKPSQDLLNEAKNHLCVNHYRLTSNELLQIKQALINGFPVIFGMSVYKSMQSPEVASTGVVPMPRRFEHCLGGHAVLIVGFSDDKQVVYVRNSWGDQWGQSGYFTLPYDYISNPNLTSDFWVLSAVKDIPDNTIMTCAGDLHLHYMSC
jgi:C1A family cysteine protease